MDPRPTVLYVVHNFSPGPVGGTELLTLWLAHQLSKRYRIFIFTRTLDPQLEEYQFLDEEYQGLKIRRVKSTNKNWTHPADFYLNQEITRLFTRYLDQVKPDLVHIQHTIGLSANIIEATAARAIPTILHLRDFYYMCQRFFLRDASDRLCNGPGDGGKCADCIRFDSSMHLIEDLAPLYSTIYEQAGVTRAEYMRRLLLLPDLIICPSNYTKEKFTQFGVPASKIMVLPDGVEVTPVQRQAQHETNGKLIFGFLGHIMRHKGPQVLVEAFKSLDQKRAILHIHGEPLDIELTQKLQTESRNLNVKFMGGYSYQQLPEILSNLDVVVNPSIVHESYSLTIHEALSAKIPVIVSDIPAQKDAVKDRIYGLHFHTEDSTDLNRKMSLLLEKPKLLAELRSNIPKIKSIKDQSKKFDKIYQKKIRKTKQAKSKDEAMLRLNEIHRRVDETRLEMQTQSLKLLEAKIKENDTKIKERDAKIKERDAKIKERDAKINQMDVHLNETETQIKNLRTNIESLESELEAIKSSLGYKMMRFYAPWIDRLFPSNRRRDRIKDALKKGLLKK